MEEEKLTKNSKPLTDNTKREFLKSLTEGLDIKRTIKELSLTEEDAKKLLSSLYEDFSESNEGGSDLDSVIAEDNYSELTCYVDGGSRGNPGPAGSGAYILDKNNKPVKKLKKYLGIATNNVAEYESLLMALKKARELGCTNMQVYADSELVVKQVRGQYKVKNETLKAIYKQVMHLVEEFDVFKITHIPREKNAEADALANKAMDEAK